jgi:enoyl-CoA hydratase/carnithine racemase
MSLAEKVQSLKSLRITESDHVAILTLANPPVNALAPAVLDDLNQALTAIEQSPEIHAIVITGGATRFFSAGADVSAFQRHTEQQNAGYSQKGLDLFDRIEVFPKAVVAAVNGFAFGGGAELALACDVRIFAESAKFGLPEITLGILPGWGGMQRLSNMIGRGRTLEISLSGRQVGAKEAQAIGLATVAVPDAELASKALATAKQLGAMPWMATKEIKARMANGAGRPLSESLPKDVEALMRLMKSDDAKEARTAFFEKRPPKFQGR